MSHIFAVVGTIPGAGATTAVASLGTALGEQRRRVALVDATAEGSRLADVLKFKGGGDLADALRRGTAVPDVQGSGPHDVAAFPAAPDTSWGSMRPDAVATLYEQLGERFEFILVDCGSDLSPARSAWLGHADEVVVVTDPDVAGSVPETTTLAGAFDVPVRGVLANRVPPREVGDAVDALDATDLSVLGVLPEDPTVGIAAEAGDSVLRTEPDSMIATVAWELALRFRQHDHDEPVVPTGTGTRQSDGATDPASADESASLADPASADERTSEGGDGDDRAAGEAAGSGSPTSAEPAPPADGASASPAEETVPIDPQPADSAESAAPSGTGESESGTSDDRPGDGGSLERATSADEDPFTSPEPRAVDDEVEPTDGEGGASGTDPQGSLLGDVRAHIGDRSPDDRMTRSGTEDPPADAPDPGGDPTDPDSAPDATEDDGAGSAAASSRSPGEESDPKSNADESEDGAASLSDEEIESLFEETMERVQERRESESVEPEDGTAAEDEEN